MKCPWCNYFHTDEWRTDSNVKWIILKGQNWYLPLSKINILKIIPVYVSNYPGIYGGYVAEKPISIKEEIKLYEKCKHKKVIIYGSPDFKLNYQKWLKFPYFTHIIELKKWNQGSLHHKRQLKYARNNNIIIRPGSKMLFKTLWESYFKKKLHYNIYSNNFVTYFSFKNEEIISGALIVTYKKTAMYLLGFNLKRNIKGASHLLHHKIIEDLIEKRFLKYDLLPSKNLTGVIRFKNEIGAEKKDFFIYTSPSIIIKHYLNKHGFYEKGSAL